MNKHGNCVVVLFTVTPLRSFMITQDIGYVHQHMNQNCNFKIGILYMSALSIKQQKEKLIFSNGVKEAFISVSEGDCRKLENIMQSATAISNKIRQKKTQMKR